MDVLEHVEDDAGLLRTYLDKAPPQAQAVITVPAFQFLWSHHDVFLEHHRRYTLKTLSRVVERAGAVPLRMHYYYGTIFPLEIGRASCRERGCQYGEVSVVAVTLKKKK